MKKSNLIAVFLSLFIFNIGCEQSKKESDSSPEIRARLGEALSKFQECYKLEDYNCISLYILPSIIDASGGFENFADKLESNFKLTKNEGIEINLAGLTFSKPDSLVRKNDILFSIIQTNQNVSIIDINGTITNSFIALSMDKGDTWFFVEGTNLGRSAVNSLAPGILQKINLPRPLLKVDSWEIRQKNGKWEIPIEIFGHRAAKKFEKCYNEENWICLYTFLYEPLFRHNAEMRLLRKRPTQQEDIIKLTKKNIQKVLSTAPISSFNIKPAGLKILRLNDFVFDGKLIYTLISIQQDIKLNEDDGTINSNILLVSEDNYKSWFIISKPLQQFYNSELTKTLKSYNIPEPQIKIGSKTFSLKDEKWDYPPSLASLIERDELSEYIHIVTSAAASYWRKPAALGGGARSFLGTTDVTTFGVDSSNVYGNFIMSEVGSNQFMLTAIGKVSRIKLMAIITPQGVREPIVELK